MHGINGARRHCPELVIEFERDMSREPKTEINLIIKNQFIEMIKATYLTLAD